MKLPWILLFSALTLPAVAGTQASAPTQTRTSSENPFLKLRGLVTLCERSDPTSVAACGSYITGFVQGSQATEADTVAKTIGDGVMRGTVPPTDDAIESASKKLQKQSNLFCIPSNWTAGHVQAVVVQYGREHADLLEEASADHMLKILAKEFPCSDAK